MTRIIKRYENRKLYDTEKRKYVSLEEIASLIREGVNIKVIENTTNADITTQTLTQVIFEEGKKGRNPLSTEVLHNVIRWGNTFLDDKIQHVREGLEDLVPKSLNKLFKNPSTDELSELKKRVASLEYLVEHLRKQEESEPNTDSEIKSKSTGK
ncbi:MAG: polyhydroxyalkanoate synthesis regulator DNA-binding domain-containing protein [Calditrichia bacterium]